MSKKFTGVHSGGQNIPVYDKDAHSAIEQKLNTSAFQSVSGNFLTAVPDAYATKEYADGAAIAAASGKLDTDTFAQVSGDFLTAVPQSYLQNTDLTVTSGKITEISGIPLSGGGTLPDTIPVSGVSGISVTETENEVLIGISADFATSADLESKLDTSAFSSVSGDFLTAVPDDFATKEYLSSQISGKYDTSSFAEVSGNFLTAVPESAISGFATHEEVESAVSGKQNTLEFGYDGKSAISGINGSALAGGGEVPEGVMVESAIGYNAVNEISGYNGSAIAQYGAEKQWLVHDDTLVHVANSAQYALGCNISALQRLMGIDETVLYENSAGFTTATSGMPLSENAYNFNKLKFVHFWNGNGTWQQYNETIMPLTDNKITLSNIVQIASAGSSGNVYYTTNSIAFESTAHNKFVHIGGFRANFGGTNTSTVDVTRITKIIGIGRKQ